MNELLEKYLDRFDESFPLMLFMSMRKRLKRKSRRVWRVMSPTRRPKSLKTKWFDRRYKVKIKSIPCGGAFLIERTLT